MIRLGAMLAWLGVALDGAGPPATPPEAPAGLDAAALEPPSRAPADPARPSPEGSSPPSRSAEQGTEALAATSRGSSAASPAPPAPRPPDGTTLAVAIGLGPEAPGSPEETALLDALERSLPFSVDPPATLRRLRPGADPRQVCGEGREDLVITVGYLPDRVPPVLLTHDCRLDVPLGVRAGEAADDVDLVAALWSEHGDLLAAGYEERRRRRLDPRVRAGLIIGGATVVIGVALGLILASALRDEAVVLKVSP